MTGSPKNFHIVGNTTGESGFTIQLNDTWKNKIAEIFQIGEDFDFYITLPVTARDMNFIPDTYVETIKIYTEFEPT